MATDGEASRQPSEDDMLPDERAVIAERIHKLEELDDEAFLTIEEVAAELGIELD